MAVRVRPMPDGAPDDGSILVHGDEITLANGEGGDPYRFLADHAFDSRSPGTTSYASQERVLWAEYKGQR